MEQKYNTTTLGEELVMLRDFCKQEGEAINYLKGESLPIFSDKWRITLIPLKVKNHIITHMIVLD